MIFSIIVFICLLALTFGGCGAGPTPRLVDLVGKEAYEFEGFPSNDGEWIGAANIGLVVHSDATAQNAAPAIISTYLETLIRRTEGFLRQRCSFQEIVPVPLLSQPGNFSQELKTQGQRLVVPYIIVVMFSSQEKSGPEKIGQATMMNLMGGTVIENSAMAEVGVLRLSDFKMVFLTQGLGTESLEQLDAPIGTNLPSPTEARDILRARAGQQALDRALEHVGAACQPAA